MTQHTSFKFSKEAAKSMSRKEAVALLESTAQILAALVQATMVNTKLLGEVTEREIITPDFEEKKEAYIRSSAQLAATLKAAAEHVSDMFALTEQVEELANEEQV